jgi:diaminopimelate epimerase
MEAKMTNEMNPTDLELRTKARTFEEQNHTTEWKKMSRKAQDTRLTAKVKAARHLAENYIETGVPHFIAWPRAIREEILETESD